MSRRADLVAEHLLAVAALVSGGDRGSKIANEMMSTHMIHFAFSVPEACTAAVHFAVPGSRAKRPLLKLFIAVVLGCAWRGDRLGKMPGPHRTNVHLSQKPGEVKKLQHVAVPITQHHRCVFHLLLENHEILHKSFGMFPCTRFQEAIVCHRVSVLNGQLAKDGRQNLPIIPGVV